MTTDDEDIILTAARPADIQIPKLGPTNYKVWSDLAVGLLDDRGVGGYITGTVKKPTKHDQLRIWHQNNAVTTSILKGTLSASQLGHVMGMQDAQEVWTTLKRIHQRDHSAKVRSLLAEFMRFKMGPMDTIDGAASTLTRIQKRDSKPQEGSRAERRYQNRGAADGARTRIRVNNDKLTDLMVEAGGFLRILHIIETKVPDCQQIPQ
jgi:gag-polypeptide of LTR copia-type